MPKNSPTDGSLLSKLGRKFMSIDKFAERPGFSVDGSDTYPSLKGTLLTILVIAVVIPFGFNKFLIMRDREDTYFHTITEESLRFEELLSYEETNANVMYNFKRWIDIEFESLSMKDLEGYIEVIPMITTYDRRDSDY